MDKRCVEPDSPLRGHRLIDGYATQSGVSRSVYHALWLLIWSTRMSRPKQLLTNSRMKAFRACKQLHHFRYVQGYRPIVDSWNLWFGTLIHICLEHYWRARKASRPDPIADMLGPLDNNDLDIYDRAKARVMLIAYASVWDTTKCTVLDVEHQFQLPLINPITGEVSSLWDRAGKVDLILKFKDGIAPTEHKTSSADLGIGGDYRRRLTLDEQISFYWAALEHVGLKPSFMAYDVLKKPKEKPLLKTPNPQYTLGKPEVAAKPPTKKKPEGTPFRPAEPPRLYSGQRLEDETPEEYYNRLIVSYKEEPESKIIRVRVQRFESERKKFHLSVWQEAQIMGICEQLDIHPPNSDACFVHGSPCEFFGVCEGTADINDKRLFKKMDTVNPELAKP